MYKVLIRPLCIEDAKVSYRWRNDSDIWRYTGIRPNKEITEEIEIDWIKKVIIDETSKRFAILVNDQYVGNIQLTNISQEKKDAEYHIFIGEKNFWGKGIATLATSQIIEYAKEWLRLESIYLFVKPENKSAINVYQKSGFKKINEDFRMEINLNEISSPLVSIFMMTYNHENFINAALEGVLMQKVNFNYQIVLGEDCSTDKTREIVLRYANQYPGMFKLVLHEQNVGALANQITVLKECTGKYIAMCEGDDYWTDPYKLQKQVDFLEANEDFAICHHNVYILFEQKKKLSKKFVPQKEITTLEDLAESNHISTPTCMFRNRGYLLPEGYDSTVGDYLLHMLNARHGKIKYFREKMAVYRITNSGIWTGQSLVSNYKNVIKALEFICSGDFPPSVKYKLKESIKYLHSTIIDLYLKDNDKKKLVFILKN